MNTQDQNNNPLSPIVIRLTNIIIILMVAVIALLVSIALLSGSEKTQKAEISEFPKADENGLFTEEARKAAAEAADHARYWHAPNESELSGHPDKNDILYGKELIAHTSDYFGPAGKVFKQSTNGMNCQNCHLDAGTKVFGNNYSAVASTYPKYRARSGSIENIYKRVNDCFERSLNGLALDTNSREMQAIVKYIHWLGKNVEKGKKPEGSGFMDIALLDRAADPEKGKLAYMEKCLSCHQANGEGRMNSEGTAFQYPPLWGPNSYNDGAGLYRLSNFAKFVKYNMPLGVSHRTAQLTDEEAWDIAAFVNSQPRPKKDISKDWPKINEKPYDHPFGPFSDGFSESQHKYGPFKMIKEKQNQKKKS